MSALRAIGSGRRTRQQTNATLGGAFGPDRARALVVELVHVHGEDFLRMNPKGTRQAVQVRVVDVYAHALRGRAAAAIRERAEAIKARKLARRRAG
jgi:hypothetical protein